MRLSDSMRPTTWLSAIAFAPVLCAAQAPPVNIWPGVAPGSSIGRSRTRHREHAGRHRHLQRRDAHTHRLSPDRSKATGTGIILAPGGAFVALAIDLEANTIAKQLQQRGVAAFVLKYRIVEKRGDGIPQMDQDTAARYGIADGIQALKVVRQHAAQWGVSPDRIGFMGFSAGAMVTSGTVLQQDSAARPNFAALIYGAPFGVMPPIPRNLPPLFLAWAQDDAIARDFTTRFYDALTRAGQKPEVHIYSGGGHGFGLKKQGTTSDHWLDDFYNWLEAQGLTKR
jgi:acetyl esterase/lipase